MKLRTVLLALTLIAIAFSYISTTVSMVCILGIRRDLTKTIHDKDAIIKEQSEIIARQQKKSNNIYDELERTRSILEAYQH